MSQRLRLLLSTITFFVAIFASFWSLTAVASGTAVAKPSKAKRVLNVYTWYEQIPTEIIKNFERDTGIKVNLDYFDSNAVLEAKLITGNTGYDVVFPTSWPHLARQIPAKIYQPIDKEKLKNYLNLDPVILEKVSGADPGNQYFIPYFWGLVGIGYNQEKVRQQLPDADLESWEIIYKDSNAQALKAYGITLLEDSTDVFLTYGIYKNLYPSKLTLNTLKTIRDGLLELRPNYRRFANTLVTEQLVAGELCVVMHWTELLTKAKNNAATEKEKDAIKIILPREGTMMWVDGMAIPSDAQNVDEAYAFIDYMLRASSGAMVTNQVMTATAVRTSRPLIRPEILTNKVLFPDADYMEKVHLPEIKSNQTQRFLTRFFSSVLTGLS